MATPKTKTTAQVWVQGDIEIDTFAKFKSDLASFGAYDTIEVNIDTRGGVLSQGLAIHDFLEYQKKKGVQVITVAWAKCASAGTIIHMAGSAGSRFVINSNAYCIHEVMNGGDLYGARANDLIEWGQQIEKDNNLLAKIYASKTGNTVEQVRAWMFEDKFWDSTTTIARGFADSILEGTEVNISENDKINLKSFSVYDCKVGLNSKMKYESYLQDSFGVPRSEMPQVDYEFQEMFIAYFKAFYGLASVMIGQSPANEIKPTQNEIDSQKVYEKMEAQTYKQRTFFVSRENYLLDGHHDWAGALEENEKQLLNIIKIDLPIKVLLKEANKLKITYKEPQNVGIENCKELLFLYVYA